MTSEFESQIKEFLTDAGYINIAILLSDAFRQEFTVWGKVQGTRELRVLAKGRSAELMPKIKQSVATDKAFFAVYA